MTSFTSRQTRLYGNLSGIANTAYEEAIALAVGAIVVVTGVTTGVAMIDALAVMAISAVIAGTTSWAADYALDAAAAQFNTEVIINGLQHLNLDFQVICLFTRSISTSNQDCDFGTLHLNF